VRPDGQRHTALVSTVPLRGADGEPAGALGTLVDVSDLRNAEAALRESESRRQWVLGELLRAEQAERARIAAELHDDTVQVMAATLFSLDRLEHADGADAAAHVRAARELLAAATERTRRLMFELRPPLLEAQGLGPALNELAIQFRRETGVEVRTMLTVHRYPVPTELLVYRVVQEAVSNCRKHARASHLLIALREEGPAIAGEVRDDGRGFDAPAALDRSRMRLHLGLDAMRERVLLAGGEYQLETAPGKGTRIAFTIPLGADI
jgi:signal transduction histidine kinase